MVSLALILKNYGRQAEHDSRTGECGCCPFEFVLILNPLICFRFQDTSAGHTQKKLEKLFQQAISCEGAEEKAASLNSHLQHGVCAARKWRVDLEAFQSSVNDSKELHGSLAALIAADSICFLAFSRIDTCLGWCSFKNHCSMRALCLPTVTLQDSVPVGVSPGFDSIL